MRLILFTALITFICASAYAMTSDLTEQQLFQSNQDDVEKENSNKKNKNHQFSTNQFSNIKMKNKGNQFSNIKIQKQETPSSNKKISTPFGNGTKSQ